jgi:hypothetical protein
MPFSPINNCIPTGTVTPGAQTLSLDCTTGNLAISEGNTVNLACVVANNQTVGVFNSLTLTGTILQAVITFEDGVQQAQNVNLASLTTNSDNISVISTNSVTLTLASNVLSANFNIDPSSTLPISTSIAGVNFGCCPETPISTNTTNTVQLTASGSNGYTLTANLKYQSTGSIVLSSTSAGLSGIVNYSTNANNVATGGTDGGIYVQSAASQLANLASNGYVTTGSSGTQLVGADSKLYRIPIPPGQTPITAINTETISSSISGINGMTITSSVNINNSNTISLTATSSGLQANVLIDTTNAGNVTISSDSGGLIASINESGIAAIQNTQATVQNPMTSVYGQLNNGAGGYVPVSFSQYGLKFPSFTTTQRSAIPTANLYDTMFVFDNTIRAFMWYDAVNSIWVQLS